MPTKPENIISDMKKAIKTIDEIAQSLDILLEEMEDFERKRNILKTIGTSLNCLGAGATIVRAFSTEGLSLARVILLSVAAASANLATFIADNSETNGCIKKIEKMQKRLNDQLREMQQNASKFNNQIEDLMRTQDVDYNSATFQLFGCPVVSFNNNSLYRPALSQINNPPIASWFTSSNAFQGFLLGESFKSLFAVCGVAFAALEFAELIHDIKKDHPSLEPIRNVKRDFESKKAALTAALTEFKGILTVARRAAMEVVTAFMENSLGGGYRTSSTSTVIPLKFPEFVEQIGRSTEGGIYNFIFMAEMLGRRIEVFDKISDGILRKQHGTDHLEIKPFVESFLDSIRIEVIGEEGAHLYRPLLADGTPIDGAVNSLCASRCLFDAIAGQLRLEPNILIEKFRGHLQNNNSVAEELYNINLQEIFEVFGVESARRPTTAITGEAAPFTRTRKGKQEIVTATTCFAYLNRRSEATDSIRNETLRNGIRGWDHAGHIVADFLGGSSDNIKNFVPMQRFLKVGPYKSFEQQIKKILEDMEAWSANITVVMTFDLDSDHPRRPTNFSYNVEFFYAVNELQFKRNKEFNNFVPDFLKADGLSDDENSLSSFKIVDRI